MALRPATWRDCLFFKRVRGGQRLIPHLYWFHDQLKRGWGLWVIEGPSGFGLGGIEPLGYLRQDADLQLSVAIREDYRNLGFGKTVLRWAASHLHAWARVHVNNFASQKAFEWAGWKKAAGLVGPYFLYKTPSYGKIEGQATDGST